MDFGSIINSIGDVASSLFGGSSSSNGGLNLQQSQYAGIDYTAEVTKNRTFTFGLIGLFFVIVTFLVISFKKIK